MQVYLKCKLKGNIFCMKFNPYATKVLNPFVTFKTKMVSLSPYNLRRNKNVINGLACKIQ